MRTGGDGVEQFHSAKRFHEYECRAEVFRGFEIVNSPDVFVTRHGDDADGGEMTSKPRDYFQTVAIGHEYIGNDDIDGINFDPPQGFPPAKDRTGIIARLGQGFGDRQTEGLVIIEN